MLYLTFYSVTTFLLPYFIGMVYFAIACWVKSEISVVATSISSAIRPEQVFTLLEEHLFLFDINKIPPLTPDRAVSRLY
jgi:hypothetical protein